MRPPAQNLATFKWITSIDLNNTGALIHYGAPLVTAANTVLVPVKTGAAGGFQVSAFNGANGAAKYTVTTDYILPTHNWIPSYNPCVATGAFGTRMYYAGAGGTIWHIDNPDSNSHGAPVREVFYTSLANYNANAAAYNATIFVNTPITADANGNIYFGFRVQGTAPAPLNTTQSGFARIDVNGNGTYVLAGAATNDASINSNSHNVAPAISNDGTTVYVAARQSTTATYGYLLGSTPPRWRRSIQFFCVIRATVTERRLTKTARRRRWLLRMVMSTSVSAANPNNGSRGFLLRFSGDLTVTKTPGAFGWDYTPGVVPASSVPSYTDRQPICCFVSTTITRFRTAPA